MANKDEFMFDPALYIEYRDRNSSGKKNILEGKFIISKDIDKLNFTSNLVWEKKLASGEPWEFEYTIAVSHPISNSAKIGVEYFAQPIDNRAYLIPGVYAQFSPTVRLNIGPAFGLTPESIDFGIRSIFSWEF
ncbi:MAG: hypothetical protein HYU63_05980 [Armatimonadetes bacterium]|nr:hypothetical protein [Armatimonadota bacterium]